MAAKFGEHLTLIGMPNNISFQALDRRKNVISLKVLTQDELLQSALLKAEMISAEELEDLEDVEYVDLNATTELEDMEDWDEDDWESEIENRAYDLEWLPSWWLQVKDCPHTSDCVCRIISFRDAISHLSPEQREEGFNAQLELIKDLGDHLNTVSLLDKDILTDNFCAGCLLDPDTHIEAIESALLDASKDLAEALLIYSARIISE